MTAQRFCLQKERSALLVVDVQEKLFPKIQRPAETLAAMQMVVQGAQRLGLPIVVTEQYAKGLGPTIPPLLEMFGDEQPYWDKTAFSCLGDSEIRQHLLAMPQTQWIVVGIEAHVCIQQTVRDLLEAERDVVVLNDAISSRSIYDYSTAISEMRDFGARISSTESVLFELLGDARTEGFREISEMIKAAECCAS